MECLWQFMVIQYHPISSNNDKPYNGYIIYIMLYNSQWMSLSSLTIACHYVLSTVPLCPTASHRRWLEKKVAKQSPHHHRDHDGDHLKGLSAQSSQSTEKSNSLCIKRIFCPVHCHKSPSCDSSWSWQRPANHHHHRSPKIVSIKLSFCSLSSTTVKATKSPAILRKVSRKSSFTGNCSIINTTARNKFKSCKWCFPCAPGVVTKQEKGQRSRTMFHTTWPIFPQHHLKHVYLYVSDFGANKSY